MELKKRSPSPFGGSDQDEEKGFEVKGLKPEEPKKKAPFSKAKEMISKAVERKKKSVRSICGCG